MNTSTPQTPEHAQRARWHAQEEAHERDNPTRVKECRNPTQFADTISFFNFQKNTIMTQARKEGKEAI